MLGKMKRLLTALLATFFLTGTVAMAEVKQDSLILRPVESVFEFGAGSAQLIDTYLTPLKYAGWGVSFAYNRTQAMKFNPENWVMKLAFHLDYDHTLNPARNATMHFAEVGAEWGMMRRFRLPYGFSAGVGPAVQLNAGCLLNSRNGNNPASAKFDLTADAVGYLSWSTRLGNVGLRIRDMVSIPVAGGFFSPDYGELYYEIWLGNHSGLAHFGWWGNFVSVSNFLSADFQIGGTLLRVGYRYGFNRTTVNHIISRRESHQFVIGIGGEWLSLNPAQSGRKARMIYANY